MAAEEFVGGPDWLTERALARLARVSVREVRGYGEAGLLRPTRVVGSGRQIRQLYAASCVQRLRRIRYYRRALGVNEAGIEIIFRLLSRLERSA